MTINLTALQKQRYDTAANWTGANPTLLAGEIGIESDTLRWKVGNGSTAWTSLAYIPGLTYGTARQLLQTNSGATGAEWTSNVDIPGTLDVTGTSTLDGMVLVGLTSSIGGGKLQLSTDSATAIQGFTFSSTADTNASTLQLIRARGTKASPSVLLNNDYIGEIRFLGYGAAIYNTGAIIRAVVDGEPATSGDTTDMPTKLVFLTTPNGSSTPDTRMTIDSAGLVTIPGDLTVNGTTTTINSTTLVVKDKNIEMGVVATPTDVTADGGGITLKGTTDKTINWIDATDAWTFSEHVNIASAKEYRIAGTKVLDATSLGSAVVGSSLTSVGTIGTGVWQGTAIADTYLGTISTALKVSNSATTATSANTASAIVARDASGNFTAGTITAALTGTASNVTTNANLTGDVTSVGNATTIAAGVIVDADINASAAIVDTKLATIATAGKVSNSATTATSANTASAIVARDASGNFTAGTITATLTGNAATVTTNANLTGDITSVGNATTIAAGVIVNADVNASAAIAGTKVAPDFGSQTVITTGSALIGTATSLSTLYSGAGKLQAASNDATTIQSYAFSSTGVDYSATLELSRARNTQASPTIVANGDYIGQINFAGYNTNFQRGATIYALVDGEPGTAGDTTDMPGKLVFATTPNGSATPTTRMSIDSAGAVTLAGTLDVPLGAAATPSITFTGDLNTGIYSPGADQLAVATNGTQRITIDSSGRLLVGTATARSKFQISTGFGNVTPIHQFEFNSQTYNGLSITHNAGANTYPAVLAFGKSRGSSADSYTAVASGDGLGWLDFYGADGTNMVRAATISAEVDGTPGANDMPGRLVFSTTADGGSSPSERLRITSAGLVGIGNSVPRGILHVGADLSNGATDAAAINLKQTSTTAATGIYLERSAERKGYYIYLGGDNDSLNFQRNNNGTKSDVMTLTRDGLVGIGSTSPSSQFSVGGASGGANPTISFDYTNDNTSKASISANHTSGEVRYSAATNYFPTFYSSGSERARIDTSGRLLVGTTSDISAGSSSLAQVSADTSSASITIRRTSVNTGGPALNLFKSRGSSAQAVSNNDVLGNIYFSGADGTNYITGASIEAYVDGTPGTNDMPGRLVFSVTRDGGSSPTEAVRIKNTGYTTTFATTDGFRVSSAAAAGTTTDLFDGAHSATAIDTGTISFRVTTNGNTTNTNNSYAGISDIKLKENIADANSQWNDLKALQVRKYNFKEETGHQTHTQIGLVAQEVELVSPRLVNESPDRDEEGNDLGTTTKSVNYSVLYMKAVKALQEAMERIEALEADVAQLKGA